MEEIPLTIDRKSFRYRRPSSPEPLVALYLFFKLRSKRAQGEWVGTPGGHRSNLLEGGMATRKRAARTRTRSFRVALRRMGAKLEDWQVRPLILGAQASTSLEVGPQHLLRRICGDDPVLGKDLADADANMQSLMEMWNQLVFDHDRDRIRLSKFPRPKHPTKDQLVALATRRDEEVTWFLRGLDAAGQDPKALGPEGEHLMRGLAQGSTFLDSMRELIGRTDEAELGETCDQID